MASWARGESVMSDSGLTDEPHAIADPLEPELHVYRHDSSTVLSLASLADAACEGVEDLLSASLRIRQLAQKADVSFDPAALRVLAMTFTYHLEMSPLMSGRPGASLGPLDGPSLFPVALRDADSEVQALWVSLLTSVTHPVVKARCADIVFTLRLKNGREAAETAVQSYLASVGCGFSDTEQGAFLLRAWELARSVNLSLAIGQVRVAMLDMAEHLLNDVAGGYPLAHLLDALSMSQGKKNTEPIDPRVDDLLDRALLADPGTLGISQIAPLVRRRAESTGDDARGRRASEAEVKAHLSDADRAVDGLVIRKHLNDAASLARRLNVPELESLAVSRLQSAPPVEW